MRRPHELLRRAGRGDADHLLVAALESIEQAIAVCGRDGRVSHLNRHARELLGAGCDGRGAGPEVWMQALRPRTASGLLLPAEDLPPLRALAGEVVSGVDVLVTLGAREVLLEVAARPACDARGYRCGAVVTFADVTRRRRDEALLRRQAQSSEPLSLRAR